MLEILHFNYCLLPWKAQVGVINFKITPKKTTHPKAASLKTDNGEITGEFGNDKNEKIA